ncbi:MAG: diaminopimelate epimerase [Fimbriimonadaceae bacterium]
MKLRFAKVQSVGNDFVLVHAGLVPDARLPELARKVSPRRFMVGSDGLLVVGQSGSRLTLRMFNPDGSEDFCGNGLRSAAWYAKHQGWVDGEFTIEHKGTVIPGRFKGEEVEVELPPASYEPQDIPVTGQPIINERFDDWQGTAVSTGSTHLILDTEALPETERFMEVGSRLEKDPRFPERTSVIWSQRVTPDCLRIRIWERGAGETLGCGTGSAAAGAVAARALGRGGTFLVANPGGTVRVGLESPDSTIKVASAASVVFTGEIELPL